MCLREHTRNNRVSARGLLGEEKGKNERVKAVLEWGHEGGRQKNRENREKTRGRREARKREGAVPGGHFSRVRVSRDRCGAAPGTT